MNQPRPDYPLMLYVFSVVIYSALMFLLLTERYLDEVIGLQHIKLEKHVLNEFRRMHALGFMVALFIFKELVLASVKKRDYKYTVLAIFLVVTPLFYYVDETYAALIKPLQNVPVFAVPLLIAFLIYSYFDLLELKVNKARNS